MKEAVNSPLQQGFKKVCPCHQMPTKHWGPPLPTPQSTEACLRFQQDGPQVGDLTEFTARKRDETRPILQVKKV